MGDVWVAADPSEKLAKREEKKARRQELKEQNKLKPKVLQRKPKMKVKGKMQATGGKPKVDEKLLQKLKEVDAANKVWVGGLNKATTWQALKKHFAEAGVTPHLVHINEKSSNGIVTFKEESEVSEAISALNGTELNGSALEVDVWTKPERKEKAPKA